MSLKGSKAGSWYDFSAGTGGLPVQAIMHQTGKTFKEAVEYGSRLANMDLRASLEDSQERLAASEAQRLQRQEAEQQEKQMKRQAAQSIWEACEPAKDTKAETYMAVYRNVHDVSGTELRFFPVGATWKDCVEGSDGQYHLVEKTNKVPAMVLASTDPSGQVVGVQRTYLNLKNAQKNTFFDNPKISKGEIKHGALLQASKNGTLYIGEGIETVASATLADPEAGGLVSLSVSNIKNLMDKVKSLNPSKVVFLKDNDGIDAKTDKTFNEAVAPYQAQSSFAVEIKEPPMLERIQREKGEKAKTDWNDILQDKALVGIRDHLGLENPTSYPESFLDRLDHWRTYSNEIPEAAKNAPHVKALQRYLALEHKTAQYLTRLYKQAKGDRKTLLKLADCPYGQELKEKTIQGAVELSQYEKGFHVAKLVGMDRRLAQVMGVKYSEELFDKPQSSKSKKAEPFAHILAPDKQNKGQKF